MQTLWKPTALFCLLLFSLATHASNWQYLVKTFPLTGQDQALAGKMNTYGAKGWELVNCTADDAQITCVFKQAISGA